MEIILNYDRKNFFGVYESSTDNIYCHSNDSASRCILKAFKAVINDSYGETVMFVIDYDGTDISIAQEHEDYINGVVTLTEHHSQNSKDIKKISVQAARKMLKEIANKAEQ